MSAKFSDKYISYGWRIPLFAAHALVRRFMQIGRYHRTWKLRMLCIAKVGPGTVIEKDVSFIPRSKIKIGSTVYLGRRCFLEVDNDSELEIGDASWISHDCHIQTSTGLRIGNKVLIGEFVSIRDSQHRFDDPNVAIKDQGGSFGHITIENNVWIGRGTLILGRPQGITIGEGSIIAANSTVNCSIPSGTIWGGNPVKFIRNR